MSNLILTSGQQEALDKFVAFLLDPSEPVFVLTGYAGTGKSTLVQHLLDTVPEIMKTLNFVNPNQTNYAIEVTATTNKAAEVLGYMLNDHIKTIHSLLGLRVHTDYRSNTTILIDARKTELSNTLLFIDEASFIDGELLSFITQKTVHKCKVVFIGDPAQLAPVKCSVAPVFMAGFPTASLTEVMRQVAGNPIMDLATKFRETVSTGKFFSFQPDGVSIQHLDRSAFEQEILQEFLSADRMHHKSKILAWTNKRVEHYNKLIRSHAKGAPQIDKGDYCSMNSHISVNRRNFQTDQVVYISDVLNTCEQYGIPGRTLELNDDVYVFMPDDWTTVKKAIVKWRQDAEYYKIAAADNWADLRATYACTVNKSQGSSYDKVYIDLSDISRCNNANQIARMLYVAVSRARHNVVFTGDFV